MWVRAWHVKDLGSTFQSRPYMCHVSHSCRKHTVCRTLTLNIMFTVTHCDSCRKSKQRFKFKTQSSRCEGENVCQVARKMIERDAISGNRHFFYYFTIALNPMGSLAVVIRRGVEFNSPKHGFQKSKTYLIFSLAYCMMNLRESLQWKQWCLVTTCNQFTISLTLNLRGLQS